MFEQALSLNPFEPASYQLGAEIYEDNKMLKKASEDYRKALELMPNTASLQSEQ